MTDTPAWNDTELLYYQVTKLLWDMHPPSLTVGLVSANGRGDAFLEFYNLVSFRMDNLPNEEFDTEPILEFQSRRLDGEERDAALIQHDWGFRGPDGKIPLQAPVYRSQLISSFSLEVWSLGLTLSQSHPPHLAA